MLASIIGFTILEGHSKQLLPPLQIENMRTIGDDIDFMNDQLQSLNSYIYPKTKSSSVFFKPDDSLIEVECKRKSYTTNSKTMANYREWSVNFVNYDFID